MSDPVEVIAHIAKVSRIIPAQAGVGAMETAGSIVSYLAMHPEQVPAFMENPNVFDWPVNWHSLDCLSWHGMDGSIHTPAKPVSQ